MVLSFHQQSATVASACIINSHDKDNSESQLLKDVTHQLNQATENSSDDVLFVGIDKQEWQDGYLVFHVRWKKDETSSHLVTRTVIQDFPLEMTQYILAL